MPSPFLGMDPYMEVRAAWAGVHLHLLANLGQQLAPQVRPRYRVHTERYLSVGEEPVKFRPDLRLQKIAEATGDLRPAAAGITEATLVTENVPYPESDIPPHLEIVAESGEVVTVIEVLSPVNKEGEFNSYLNKRYRLLKAGINLVEIDLLREGQRAPLGVEIAAPYLALVSRAHEYPKTHVWGMGWQDPLPVLPAPLRPDEPDARLQLGMALAQAYAVEFEGFVDYSLDPPGIFTEDWRREVEALLQAKGLR
jgi:hypothetical protein